jgi:hypothetical protein
VASAGFRPLELGFPTEALRFAIEAWAGVDIYKWPPTVLKREAAYARPKKTKYCEIDVHYGMELNVCGSNEGLNHNDSRQREIQQRTRTYAKGRLGGVTDWPQSSKRFL